MNHPSRLLPNRLQRTRLALSAIGSIAVIALAIVPLTSDSVTTAEARRVKPGRGLNSKIQNLASNIYHNANRSRANRRQLEKAKWHLEQAQALLNQRGGYDGGHNNGGGQHGGGYDNGGQDNKQRCVQWAYANYSKSYGSATAWNQAQRNCTDEVNFRIAKLFYPYFAKSYGASTAMNEALKTSKLSGLTGKRRLIEFSITNYMRSYGAATAARETIRQVRKVNQRSLPCIEQSYNAYSKSYGSSTAMNEAFRVCKKRR